MFFFCWNISFFTEVVTYRDECYYLQMFYLHQMMTIAYKSNQSKKTKIKINLQLSVWVFIMLVLHGNVNIKFLLDSQTVYCKFLAKIIVDKLFIVTQSCWKYTFTEADWLNRFKHVTCYILPIIDKREFGGFFRESFKK